MRLTSNVVQLDWFGVVIQDVPVYIDQEGVAWDRAHGRCPRCPNTPTDYTWRNRHSGFFECPECGVWYDEPNWLDPEAAFVTCISDEDAGNDSDAGIRALYREYHDLMPEEGWAWPPRPTK